VIIDCAYYKDGRRQHEEPLALEEAASRCTAGEGGFVWVGLHDPTAEELEAVASRFDLHELAVEDAASAHQRPKLEDYGGGRLITTTTPRRWSSARSTCSSAPGTS
jgi:magnesium transporter